jgi:hypothetical protein
VQLGQRSAEFRERIQADEEGEGRVETARQSDHEPFAFRGEHTPGKPGRLDIQNFRCPGIELCLILGDKRVCINVPGQPLQAP